MYWRKYKIWSSKVICFLFRIKWNSQVLISVSIELPRPLYLNMQSGSQWQCTHVGQDSEIRNRVPCLFNTTKRSQISSRCTCHAMVEYTLKSNRSFKQLAHNSRIDLEILWNNKNAVRRWPSLVIHHGSRQLHTRWEEVFTCWQQLQTTCSLLLLLQ